MVKKELTITNANGLHTRPGNDFVKIAKQFTSEISLVKGEKTIDAKSLLKVMKANIVQGDVITICCSGEDETDALSALGNFFAALDEVSEHYKNMGEA